MRNRLKTRETATVDQARDLFGRGRIPEARRVVQRALDEHPDDPRAIALMARLDVVLHRVPVSEAVATVRSLVREHPEDLFLQITEILIRAAGGDLEEAIGRLRELQSLHEEDAFAHQALAALLYRDEATRKESWLQFKLALEIEPLSGLSAKIAAYHAAVWAERKKAKTALRGSSPLERAIVRTRIAEVGTLIWTFLGLALVGFFIRLIWGDPTWSAALLGVSTAFGVWVSFVLYYMGKPKALILFGTCVTIFWLAFALSGPLSGENASVPSVNDPAAYCPSPLPGALTETGSPQRLLIVTGTFKPSVTGDISVFQQKVTDDLRSCSGGTERLGDKVFKVYGTALQKLLFTKYIVSYLETTNLFSSVRAAS